MHYFYGVNFLGLPPELSSKQNSHFVIIPVPYERTTTFVKGTRFAPHAIIEASQEVELLDEELLVQASDAGIFTDEPFIENPEPEDLTAALSKKISPYIQQDKFVFLLGGEHTISLAPVSLLSKKSSRLSVIVFDAHPDMRDIYQDSKYNHACVSRRLSEYCPVVIAGARTISAGELDYLKKSPGATVFFFHKFSNPQTLLKEILQKLTDDVYISIDMDVFAPSEVPAVGTPVPGGFSWREIVEITKGIIDARNVVGADIVELVPISGSVRSEFLAARLAYKIITYVAYKKGFCRHKYG